MTLKENILQSLTREVENCKHLFTKIPEGTMDWRPLPDMRSTRELLQYLSFIGLAQTDLHLKPAASHEDAIAGVRARSAASSSLQPEDFPAAMDKELAYMKSMIEPLSDSEIQTCTGMDFSGKQIPLSEALLTTVKNFTAYRHQLFLYARMNGAKITTSNNWRGVDPAPVVKKETAPQAA